MPVACLPAGHFSLDTGKMMSKTLCSLLQPMTEAHLSTFHTFKAGGPQRRAQAPFPRSSPRESPHRRLLGVCADSHYEIYYGSLIDRFPLLPSSPSSLSRTTPLLAPGTSKSAVMPLRCVVSSHSRKGDRPITLASSM